MFKLWLGAARGTSDRAGIVRRHQFSSGDFFDAARMGFGALRILDEVFLAPGATVESERRANMDILTWVIDGEIEITAGDEIHVLSAGGLACISAGSGIDCALRNHTDAPTRLMQLWLQPTVVNAPPRMEMQHFSDAELRRGFRRIAAATGVDSAVSLRADASIYAARGNAGETFTLRLPTWRLAWLQILRGSADLDDLTAYAGDGIAISDEDAPTLTLRDDAEVLLIALR